MPVYRRSPPGLRNLASPVWGRPLDGSRYGAEPHRLVADAVARETWSGDAWESYIAEKMAAQLRVAYEDVPYYREVWQGRLDADGASPAPELAQWPVLKKTVL